jgi:hypothetical protein
MGIRYKNPMLSLSIIPNCIWKSLKAFQVEGSRSIKVEGSASLEWAMKVETMIIIVYGSILPPSNWAAIVGWHGGWSPRVRTISTNWATYVIFLDVTQEDTF